jgi:hypothetical protein
MTDRLVTSCKDNKDKAAVAVVVAVVVVEVVVVVVVVVCCFLLYNKQLVLFSVELCFQLYEFSVSEVIKLLSCKRNCNY